MQFSCPEKLRCGGQHNYRVKFCLCSNNQVTGEDLQADIFAQSDP